MRLSTVFELLLIFLLIAFAAYGRVIDTDVPRQMGVEMMSLKQATENVNKYCVCNANICNCCRNFNIPIVQLKGPGCASLQYLEDDKLAVQLSVGENILTSTVVNGQKPKAVCFPMPGGLTKFCGRIYSIQREADNHFKACLGLELESSTELEAALRVSCFRFGPDGVQLRPAEPLPIVQADKPASDDDDDDDDIFGLSDDDDDDDYDDEDAPEGNAVPGSSAANDEDDDDDDDDILGFGALIDIFTGGDDADKKKKPTTTASPILPFTIPMLTKPTQTLSNAIVKPVTASPEILLESAPTEISTADDSDKIETETESTLADNLTDEPAEESSTEIAVNDEKIEDNEPEASNNVEYFAVSPEQNETIGLKKISTGSKNKPSLSPNAIKNEIVKPSSVIVPRPPVKPVAVPVKAQQVQQIANDEDDEDDDDDDDILGTSDLDDDDDDEEAEEIENDEEETENDEDNDEAESAHDDDVEDLIKDEDDDDEEEEDAVLSALVEDDVKIKDKVADNEAANHEIDDNDYGLAELLSRKRQMRSGRQSKVMRL